MTRAIHDLEGSIEKEATLMVSSDVNFANGRFPEYKIGAKDSIIEDEELPEAPSLKEIAANESAQLLEQKRRLSVRDIAKKFEDGLAAASKLPDEAKWKQVASLDRQVLLRKLRDVLFGLRSSVTGRNKDDVEEAITMVEALAVQLTQREGELLHEKAELKKLASFLKQTIEDSKKAVEEERKHAYVEIEKARAAVERVEKALQEQEPVYSSNESLDLEEFKKEIQEARRIKMLHQPSKVMDMEHELRALRILLAEKSTCCIQLKKELERAKRLEENMSNLFELEGSQSLGSSLQIVPHVESAPDISNCSIQWYRVIPEGSKKERITGASKASYAPEPFDVGHLVQAEISFSDQTFMVTTASPIDPAAGLGSYVDALVKRPDTEFNVIVTQMNGRDYSSKSVHVFHVGKLRMKLRKGRSNKARESYSSSMQLCGIRGGGNAAAQSLFWQAKKGVSFTLSFESERERNAAIMLARRFSLDCNVVLAGPGDQVSTGN